MIHLVSCWWFTNSVNARKDYAPAAVKAPIAKVAVFVSSSRDGWLIQTTSG